MLVGTQPGSTADILLHHAREPVVQAGQAMQAYSAWQPKEFDTAQAEAAAQAASTSAAAGDLAGTGAPGSAPEGQSGFVYDSNSGEKLLRKGKVHVWTEPIADTSAIAFSVTLSICAPERGGCCIHALCACRLLL